MRRSSDNCRVEGRARTIDRADRLIIPWLRKWAIPTLRVSLAVVFIWFGALKVFGVSPVRDIVAATLPSADPDWFVPLLGVIEVAVGMGLLMRLLLRLVLALLVLQMLGTFLVFVLLPELAFQGGNPLLLTTEGEFVLKNLVLLGAGLTVGAKVGEEREQIPEGSNEREPGT